MDGYEAIRLLRLIEPLKGVPILAVSADSVDEAEAAARAAGADGFVAKPVAGDVLLQAIGQALALDWVFEGGAVETPQDLSAPAPAGPIDRPLRLLAADDNLANQSVLRALLHGLDVELEVVADGEAAVQAVQAGGFDAVLMDVQMPRMNGLDASRAIRVWEAASGAPRTPIIALSADGGSEQVAACRAAGMDAHLDKPIDIEQLHGLLGAIAAGCSSEALAA